MSAAALDRIRQDIAQKYPDALPLAHATVAAVGTGIAALDALLPGAGLPRGRLTSWEAGGGTSAILRAACATVLTNGERAAWVDGARTVTADAWRAGPLLLRPPGEVEALACAEELLRSGGFGLVVVTGLGRHAARCDVRLARAAKAGGSALVLVGAATDVAALRVACGIDPDAWRWRADPFGGRGEPVAVRIRLEARALGWSGATSFELPVSSYGARAALDPLLVDRRGVVGGRSAWRRNRGKISRAAGPVPESPDHEQTVRKKMIASRLAG